MFSTKEEIGANAAAFVYAVVVVISIVRGASIGEAAIRGGLCAAASSIFGQFLGGLALKSLASRPEGGEKPAP